MCLYNLLKFQTDSGGPRLFQRSYLLSRSSAASLQTLSLLKYSQKAAHAAAAGIPQDNIGDFLFSCL